jgi:hypothetical protein
MKKLLVLSFLSALIFISARAEDVITLGSPGMEGEIISPQGILEGPDGNIYVYDEVDAFIKVYSPQGKFLRKMGGEGQGPGEIQRRDGVSFGFTPDGKLFFTEFFGGHRWITLLQPTGELASVIKLDIGQSFGVPNAVSLPGGGFLAEFQFSGEPDKQKDYYLHKSPIKLLRLDAEGKVTAEIKKTDLYTRISYLPAGADSELPFIPRFIWCLFKNQTVIFSEGLSNKIEAYDLSGKLIETISTQLPEPEPVKDKDVDAWREARKRSAMERNPGWYHQFGSVIEKYTTSIYKLKPMIDGLAVTPEGNILVSGGWDMEKNSRDYWLLDESGKILASIGLGAGRIVISKDFVFIVTADEEMNMQVRCLKRSGSDKDDFLRAARSL